MLASLNRSPGREHEVPAGGGSLPDATRRSPERDALLTRLVLDPDALLKALGSAPDLPDDFRPISADRVADAFAEGVPALTPPEVEALLADYAALHCLAAFVYVRPTEWWNEQRAQFIVAERWTEIQRRLGQGDLPPLPAAPE